MREGRSLYIDWLCIREIAQASLIADRKFPSPPTPQRHIPPTANFCPLVFILCQSFFFFDFSFWPSVSNVGRGNLRAPLQAYSSFFCLLYQLPSRKQTLFFVLAAKRGKRKRVKLTSSLESQGLVYV